MSRITKKDLANRVAYVNEAICEPNGQRMELISAYGGYSLKFKDPNGTSVCDGVCGFGTAAETMRALNAWIGGASWRTMFKPSAEIQKVMVEQLRMFEHIVGMPRESLEVNWIGSQAEITNIHSKNPLFPDRANSVETIARLQLAASWFLAGVEKATPQG